MISLIVAYGRNRVIGLEGDLPWRLPNDLKHFKQLTLGKTVLMGRKTWISLGRPLPQRENWVLTRDLAFADPGCRVFHSVEEALAAHDDGELMVIGGAELYRQLIDRADRLYVTEVDASPEGDAWFPALEDGDWTPVERVVHAPDERHAYGYTFLTLDRRQC